MRQTSVARQVDAVRGGAGGPFNPKTLGDLKVWLDATDVAGTGTNLASGTVVTSWKDKSDYKYHATGIGNPVLSHTAMNGKPGFLLNGTMTFFGEVFSNTGTAVTAFAVARVDSTSGGAGRIVSLGSAGDDVMLYVGVPLLAYVGNIRSYRQGYKSSKGIPAFNTPFYASSVFDGTDSTVYVNGIAGTTVAAGGGAFNMSQYGIGGHAGRWDFLIGGVSEVLVYNASLSTTDRQTIETYLATKWGI